MKKKYLKNECGDLSYFTIFVILAINMLLAFVLLFASVKINCINIRNAAKMELNNVSAAFGLKNDGYLGQATLAVLEDTQSDTGWFSNGTVNITAGKLARMGFGKQVLKPANVQKLNAACNSYGINSKTKVRHFLAQGMAETDQGKTFTEYVYRPGDTSKYTQYAPFCGAGFIQLTWSHTYSAFRTYMKSNKNIDDSKITVPAEYATQHVADTYPFESAGWFWHVYKDLNSKIVEWASLSAADTVKNVTAVVKGSSAGYETRLSYYEKAKTIFK